MPDRRSVLARLTSLAAAAGLVLAAQAARADIHIGVILSLTGPGASLGIPEEQALKLWPDTMAGQKLRFTVLNDATDTTTATKNAQKLITEDKVDAILGASLTPTSLAVVEVAGTARVPVISLAGGGRDRQPAGRTAQVGLQAEPDRDHQRDDGAAAHAGPGRQDHGHHRHRHELRRGFLRATEGIAAAKKIRIVASERYNQTDQSVTAQVAEGDGRQPRRGVHLQRRHARARCRTPSSSSAATRA